MKKLIIPALLATGVMLAQTTPPPSQDQTQTTKKTKKTKKSKKSHSSTDTTAPTNK